MTGHYDPILVGCSFLLSILASWIALDLAGRVHLQSSAEKRALWLSAGSVAMGIGIWSMHYVGMLAYRTAMPVLYDWPTVVLSMAAAVAASAIALWTVNRRSMAWGSTVLGGAFMGGGIACMHYIGMAAMRMPGRITYSSPLVMVSVAVAVAISIAGLRLTFGAKSIDGAWSRQKAVSALMMGLAIPFMHYIGMAAAHVGVPSSMTQSGDLRHAVHISGVSTVAIILLSVLVLLVAFCSAFVDRHVSRFQSALHGSRRSILRLRQHNQRINSAFRAGGVGIWECDPATGLFYVDESLRELYGIALDGKPVPRELWTARVHTEDIAALNERWAACLKAGDTYQSEYRIVRPSGELRQVRSVASLLRLQDGSLERIQGMTWDVTAERQREQDAREQASIFRMTLESIGDAVISTDDQRRITFLNRVAGELTGWGLKEAVGRPLEQVFVTRDEDTDAPRMNPVQRCIESGGSFLAEDGVLVSRAGERHNIRKHVSLMGRGSAAVICFQDITASRRLERELLHAATHDDLTELPNRKAFEKRVTALWEENRYSPRTHCLCILDLDRFKVINDTSGHLAGDALLREVAQTLHASLRPTDLAARMGGDEFMLLLTDTSQAEGEMLLTQLLGVIEEIRFLWRGRMYDVTASVGMVVFDCLSPDPDVLISQTDVALFTAKRQGRNQISVYTEESGVAASHHLEMEVVTDIRRCLEENRFELHAQPIVPAADPSDARYFELLLRMRNKAGELVPPSVFIPAAERYGLMPAVDRWVIRCALEQYGHYAADLPGHQFAINLCGESLSEAGLWSFVQEHLALTGVPARSITFEVTETGLIQNLQHARAFMAEARDAGCRIALDDFGTGLSSLGYLKQFPLDIIKIDGTFIRNVGSSSMDQAIVLSVAQIARSVGATTVGECVEDMATLQILQSLGVDRIQGWATGKPAPLTETLEQLRRASMAGRQRPLVLVPTGTAAEQAA